MPASNKFRAIIVDDEYPARTLIRELARRNSDVIEIVGEARDGNSAAALIGKVKPEVIFLDITMPGMGGFELLSAIGYQPHVIFTTAYEQYAIRAFETNALDYLVKPIEEHRFAQSMQKLRRIGEPHNERADIAHLKSLFAELRQEKESTTVSVKIGDKFILLRLEDVVYLEAKEKYVYIITGDDKEYLSDTRLAKYEEILPSHFLRVQKSFIINKERIGEIHKYFGSRYIVIMNDKKKTRITTGGTYVSFIRERLGL